MREHGKPVFQQGRVHRVAVGERDEGDGVTAGAEGVFDDKPLDLSIPATLGGEPAVAQGEVPGDAGLLGVVGRDVVEPAGNLSLRRGSQRPCVAGPAVRGKFTGVALAAGTIAHIRTTIGVTANDRRGVIESPEMS